MQCPYCYEELGDIASFCLHLEGEHPYEVKDDSRGQGAGMGRLLNPYAGAAEHAAQVAYPDGPGRRGRGEAAGRTRGGGGDTYGSSSRALHHQHRAHTHHSMAHEKQLSVLASACAQGLPGRGAARGGDHEDDDEDDDDYHYHDHHEHDHADLPMLALLREAEDELALAPPPCYGAARSPHKAKAPARDAPRSPLPPKAEAGPALTAEERQAAQEQQDLQDLQVQFVQALLLSSMGFN